MHAAHGECANWYSSGLAQPSILPVMISCAYCGQPATMRIVSNPEQVCLEHGLEFWTGLLVCARDRGDPPVKHGRSCACGACQELSAPELRAVAIMVAGPSPADHERFPIRLAS